MAIVGIRSRVGIGLAGFSLLSACAGSTGSPARGTPYPAGTVTVGAEPTVEVTSTTEPAASPIAGAITVELAGPPPHFVPADLTAPSGEIVFFLHNRSQGTHTLAIGRELYKALTISGDVAKGQAAAFRVHGLKVGDYIIWCTIDGHAVDGMVGTLTVT